MKAKDIVPGETYAYKRGPGRYNDAEPVKVLRVGRYGTTHDDEQETHYYPVKVVVEHVAQRPGALGRTRMLVTLGQIIGTWAVIGPRVEAEKQARQERIDAVRREQEENARRWAEVQRRAGTLGIDTDIPAWNLKEPKNRFSLDVMEALIELAEKGIDS